MEDEILICPNCGGNTGQAEDKSVREEVSIDEPIGVTPPQEKTPQVISSAGETTSDTPVEDKSPNGISSSGESTRSIPLADGSSEGIPPDKSSSKKASGEKPPEAITPIEKPSEEKTQNGPSYWAIFAWMLFIEYCIALGTVIFFICGSLLFIGKDFQIVTAMALPFAIIDRAIIGILGAKGQNPTNTKTSGYLLMMFLSYLPILFLIPSWNAAKYYYTFTQCPKIVNKKPQIISLGVAFSVSLAVFVYFYGRSPITIIQGYGSLNYVPIATRVYLPTMTALPSRILPTNPPSKTTPTNLPPVTLPTNLLPTSKAEAPTQNVPPDCAQWSIITLKDVGGNERCVWGYIIGKYSDQGVFYLAFGPEKQDLYFLSYDKDFSEFKKGDCVWVRADIQQISASPVIVINYSDKITKCNE